MSKTNVDSCVISSGACLKPLQKDNPTKMVEHTDTIRYDSSEQLLPWLLQGSARLSLSNKGMVTSNYVLALNKRHSFILTPGKSGFSTHCNPICPDIITVKTAFDIALLCRDSCLPLRCFLYCQK